MKFRTPSNRRRSGSQVNRQHPPAPTGADQVAHGVDHLPEINLAWTVETQAWALAERSAPILVRQNRMGSAWFSWRSVPCARGSARFAFRA